MARTTRSTSVTDRDGYIVDQAMIYAIAHIQSLPVEMQEFGNMADMCAIVLHKFSDDTPTHIACVAFHTGRSVNLWPLELSSYSPSQLQQKAALEPRIDLAIKINTVFAVINGSETSEDPEITALIANVNKGGAVCATGEIEKAEAA